MNDKPFKPFKPSPPWFGGLILACLTAAALWILTYTLSPLPGQQTLGGWNYAIVGTLLTLFITLSMRWHGDPLDKSRQQARAEHRQRAARGQGRDEGRNGSAAGSAG